MRLLRLFGLILIPLLVSCVSKPPKDVDNICHVFKQYPQWRRDAIDVQRRWRVPVPVQMAIIHQESKFNGRAKPQRTKLFWVIPGKHQSSAVGYTQALRSTWALYKKTNGSILSHRGSFSDGVDFIGWYANMAYRQAGIPRNDAYRLYLAYHEGIGGYRRKTYLKKSWLIPVAKKVQLRSQIYAAQLQRCGSY